MACAGCKLPYPDGLVQPLMLMGAYTEPMCGICALELINVFHGTERKSFDGMMAEMYRRRAIEWRAAHPEMKPESLNEKKETKDANHS